MGDPLTRLSRVMCEALERHLQDGRRPRVPDAGALLWSCFADLCAARRIGEAGPDPIPLAEILAWGKLHRMRLEARHVAVIRALDAVWLENARGQRAQPLTPEAFDAAFA